MGLPGIAALEYGLFMADRYDSLAPKDLIITLRSLRRRFDQVGGAVRSDPSLLARLDDEGPEGQSIGQQLHQVAVGLEHVGDAIIDLATHVEPSIDERALALEAAGSTGPRLAVEKSTAQIGDVSERVADVLDDQEADGWQRVAAVSGSSASVDLVTLVRSAVRFSIEGLRSAERIVDWLRSTEG